jgi:hypothetical protein
VCLRVVVVVVGAIELGTECEAQLAKMLGCIYVFGLENEATTLLYSAGRFVLRGC